MPTNTPSIGQLKRAVAIAEQIETLQAELASIFGGTSSASHTTQPQSAKPSQKAGRRTMSAEARAKIAASTRARWARVKGTAVAAPKPAPAATPNKKGGLTPEGRARLAAMTTRNDTPQLRAPHQIRRSGTRLADIRGIARPHHRSGPRIAGLRCFERAL